MMYVVCIIVFAATDVASVFLNVLKSNYLKYQATAKLLDQIISKGFQAST